MAVLGDERLFALLERDGEAIARGDDALRVRRRRRARGAGDMGEGRGRPGRRAGAGRDRRPDHAQPRPLRSVTRSRRRPATPAAPRRGRRVRAARRRPDRRGAGGDAAGRARLGSSGCSTTLGLATGRSPTRSALSWTTSATDKKHAAGQLRWVLPTADGVVVRDDIEPATSSSAAAAGSWPCERGAAGMTRVLVLQGPNLNLLGTREPEIYGYDTLEEIHAGIAARAAELGLEVDFFQSNHEGALIDRLHERDFDVAIVNAGGLTHTCVALRDALLAVQRPFIEVHLSDPATREPFRQVNFLHDVALESIVGQGARGYHLALESIARRFGRRRWLTDPSRGASPPSCAGCGGGSTRSIGGSWRCSTSARSWRARPAGQGGRGRRAIRDAEREREVLLRVTMANEGPLAQADLLALYRRLMAADPCARGAGPGAARSGPTIVRRRGPTPIVTTDGRRAEDAVRTGADRPSPSRTRGERDLRRGLAGAEGGRVLLRIEDHDRVRSRPAFEADLLEDLAWLGFAADEGPVRHRPDETRVRRRARATPAADLVYGCDCTRSTFEAWARDHGRQWHGAGLPRRVPRAWPGRAGAARRARRWLRTVDGPLIGPCLDEVAGGGGDLSVRDRDGHWTYGFSVVVDDLRQGVDLVVRGRTCSAPRPPRSAWAGCSAARRRRRSRITRWSAARTAASCPRPTAPRRFATCARPVPPRPS